MKNRLISKPEQKPRAVMKSALAALALLIVAATPAQAGPTDVGNLGNPGIAPPQSHFRGQTYGEWSAAWFQWVMSMPFTRHPLFDATMTDCSAGQQGDVWFIGGTLGGGGVVNRDCTIPAGTALFLAIASNGPVDNTGCDATGTVVQRTHFTVDQLRSFADANLDSFLLGPPPRGFLAVDGVEARNLSGLDPPYRFQSSVFSYTVPALDNLLVLLNGPCYNNPPAADLTVDTAVADGVYVMITPLPVGEHTISFGKDFGGGVRHTYHITVTGSGESVGPLLRREW